MSNPIDAWRVAVSNHVATIVNPTVAEMTRVAAAAFATADVVPVDLFIEYARRSGTVYGALRIGLAELVAATLIERSGAGYRIVPRRRRN